MSTVQEKYEFLLSKLVVTEIDRWENDGLIVMPHRLYFQFSHFPGTIDECVQAALDADLWRKRNE